MLLSAFIVMMGAVSLPLSEAAYTCDWGYGPVWFHCVGEGGCVPGAGFTPQGDAFVGCAAWD